MWSLGIILVLLLTNKYPIHYQTQYELQTKISNADFDNLNWDDLKQPWRKIIQEGCLQINRQQRWTAQQILSALTPPVSPSPNPSVLTLMLPGGVALEMIKIPAGSFLMGSAENELIYSRTCIPPQHQVILQEYYLGKYPVTQEQYQAVMGDNPSYFKDNPRNPVERVTWIDTKAFCQKVYEITGQKVRLPTEAEWEYGCRAGTTTLFYFGETILAEQANYHGNYTFGQEKKGIHQVKTTPVESFPANKFGLYDMHGNVWEWCEDSYHTSYTEQPESLKSSGNIRSFSNTTFHILRGGSWLENHPLGCFWAIRDKGYADGSFMDRGFRLAFSIS